MSVLAGFARGMARGLAERSRQQMQFKQQVDLIGLDFARKQKEERNKEEARKKKNVEAGIALGKSYGLNKASINTIVAQLQAGVTVDKVTELIPRLKKAESFAVQETHRLQSVTSNPKTKEPTKNTPTFDLSKLGAGADTFNDDDTYDESFLNPSKDFAVSPTPESTVKEYRIGSGVENIGKTPTGAKQDPTGPVTLDYSPDRGGPTSPPVGRLDNKATQRILSMVRGVDHLTNATELHPTAVPALAKNFDVGLKGNFPSEEAKKTYEAAVFGLKTGFYAPENLKLLGVDPVLPKAKKRPSRISSRTKFQEAKQQQSAKASDAKELEILGDAAFLDAEGATFTKSDGSIGFKEKGPTGLASKEDSLDPSKETIEEYQLVGGRPVKVKDIEESRKVTTYRLGTEPSAAAEQTEKMLDEQFSASATGSFLGSGGTDVNSAERQDIAAYNSPITEEWLEKNNYADYEEYREDVFSRAAGRAKQIVLGNSDVQAAFMADLATQEFTHFKDNEGSAPRLAKAQSLLSIFAGREVAESWDGTNEDLHTLIDDIESPSTRAAAKKAFLNAKELGVSPEDELLRPSMFKNRVKEGIKSPIERRQENEAKRLSQVESSLLVSTEFDESDEFITVDLLEEKSEITPIAKNVSPERRQVEEQRFKEEIQTHANKPQNKNKVSTLVAKSLQLPYPDAGFTTLSNTFAKMVDLDIASIADKDPEYFINRTKLNNAAIEVLKKNPSAESSAEIKRFTNENYILNSVYKQAVTDKENALLTSDFKSTVQAQGVVTQQLEALRTKAKQSGNSELVENLDIRIANSTEHAERLTFSSVVGTDFKNQGEFKEFDYDTQAAFLNNPNNKRFFYTLSTSQMSRLLNTHTRTGIGETGLQKESVLELVENNNLEGLRSRLELVFNQGGVHQVAKKLNLSEKQKQSLADDHKFAKAKYNALAQKEYVNNGSKTRDINSLLYAQSELNEIKEEIKKTDNPDLLKVKKQKLANAEDELEKATTILAFRTSLENTDSTGKSNTPLGSQKIHQQLFKARREHKKDPTNVALARRVGELQKTYNEAIQAERDAADRELEAELEKNRRIKQDDAAMAAGTLGVGGSKYLEDRAKGKENEFYINNGAYFDLETGESRTSSIQYKPAIEARYKSGEVIKPRNEDAYKELEQARTRESDKRKAVTAYQRQVAAFGSQLGELISSVNAEPAILTATSRVVSSLNALKTELKTVGETVGVTVSGPSYGMGSGVEENEFDFNQQDEVQYTEQQVLEALAKSNPTLKREFTNSETGEVEVTSAKFNNFVSKDYSEFKELAAKKDLFVARLIRAGFTAGKVEGQTGTAMSNKDLDRLLKIINANQTRDPEVFAENLQGYYNSARTMVDAQVNDFQSNSSVIAVLENQFMYSPDAPPQNKKTLMQKLIQKQGVPIPMNEYVDSLKEVGPYFYKNLQSIDLSLRSNTPTSVQQKSTETKEATVDKSSSAPDYTTEERAQLFTQMSINDFLKAFGNPESSNYSPEDVKQLDTSQGKISFLKNALTTRQKELEAGMPTTLKYLQGVIEKAEAGDESAINTLFSSPLVD